MVKTQQNKYDIGDIVFVNGYDYTKSKKGDSHLFVVIDDDNQSIPLDYFGMIVLSHMEKSKDNSNYEYNEPLTKNSTNNLKSDSIVKCDKLYELPKSNVQFKIGTVDLDDYMRFINAYNNFLKAELETSAV